MSETKEEFNVGDWVECVSNIDDGVSCAPTAPKIGARYEVSGFSTHIYESDTNLLIAGLTDNGKIGWARERFKKVAGRIIPGDEVVCINAWSNEKAKSGYKYKELVDGRQLIVLSTALEGNLTFPGLDNHRLGYLPSRFVRKCDYIPQEEDKEKALKFKIGDLVRILDRHNDVDVAPVWVDPNITRLIGKVFEIKEASDIHPGAWKIASKKEGEWAYKESWLESCTDFRVGDKVKVITSDVRDGTIVGKVFRVKTAPTKETDLVTILEGVDLDRSLFSYRFQLVSEDTNLDGPELDHVAEPKTNGIVIDYKEELRKTKNLLASTECYYEAEKKNHTEALKVLDTKFNEIVKLQNELASARVVYQALEKENVRQHTELNGLSSLNDDLIDDKKRLMNQLEDADFEVDIVRGRYNDLLAKQPIPPKPGLGYRAIKYIKDASKASWLTVKETAVSDFQRTRWKSLRFLAVSTLLTGAACLGAYKFGPQMLRDLRDECVREFLPIRNQPKKELRYF